MFKVNTVQDIIYISTFMGITWGIISSVIGYYAYKYIKLRFPKLLK